MGTALPRNESLKFLTHRRTSGRKPAQIYFVVKKEHGLSVIETKLEYSRNGGYVV